jgi:hypothetical protein
VKQRQIRGVKRGKKPANQHPKQLSRSKLERRGPLPPRWWRGKELNDRDDERAWMDW